MADRKVKRNTSKQIISYTLDPKGADSYGTVKFPASKTDYIRAGFNKVLYSAPIELINPTPSVEITIISEERLDLKEFVGFKDAFSARYELPQTKLKYYQFAQSWETKDRAHGYTRLEFNKVVFGPPQKSPGRYTITKELIDSGNDLKFTYYVNAFNRTLRVPTIVGRDNGLRVTVRAGLERIRQAQGKTYDNPIFAESIETGQRDLNIPLNNVYVLKNEDMKEFDEWQIAGVAGTAIESYLGYLVDSSFWDIQLISN